MPHPRSARGWLAIGGGALALALGAFVVLYFVVLGGSSVAPLALSTANPSQAAAAGAASAAPLTALAGDWSIASGSVAGYRVREQLASLPAQSDAVGRTSQVSGSVTVTGTSDALTVSAASLTVDVSTLSSNESMRDNRIRNQGLESNRFPKATFELTQPVTLPADASGGATITVNATGKLTIHGSTQTVTIPLQARIASNQIEVAGSITFPFEKFGMTPPSIGGFVSVQDSATMEFDIKLAHS
ncbi:MAG: YceI family protein [Candidatus Dormibacteria bacterium]